MRVTRISIILLLVAYLFSNFGCGGSDLAFRPPIDDVSFVSASDAWLVTKDGELVRVSADAPMRIQKDIVTKVRSVSFLGDSVGWAVGVDGRQWSFSDDHWLDSGKSRVAALPYSQIVYVSDKIAWLHSLESLLVTEDQGLTWTSAMKISPGELNGFFASGLDTAYLYGVRGNLKRSQDRGRTWTSENLGVASDVSAMDCYKNEPGICWIVTTAGHVYVRSADATYQQRQVNRGDIGLFSVSLSNENGPLVSGMIYPKSINDRSQGILMTTPDNGQTWNLIDVPQDERFTKVSSFGKVIWLASNSRVYRSADGGKSWTTLADLAV